MTNQEKTDWVRIYQTKIRLLTKELEDDGFVVEASRFGDKGYG